METKISSAAATILENAARPSGFELPNVRPFSYVNKLTDQGIFLDVQFHTASLRLCNHAQGRIKFLLQSVPAFFILYPGILGFLGIDQFHGQPKPLPLPFAWGRLGFRQQLLHFFIVFRYKIYLFVLPISPILFVKMD